MGHGAGHALPKSSQGIYKKGADLSCIQTKHPQYFFRSRVRRTEYGFRRPCHRRCRNNSRRCVTGAWRTHHRNYRYNLHGQYLSHACHHRSCKPYNRHGASYYSHIYCHGFTNSSCHCHHCRSPGFFCPPDVSASLLFLLWNPCRRYSACRAGSLCGGSHCQVAPYRHRPAGVYV